MTGTAVPVTNPFAINGGTVKIGGSGGNTYEAAVSNFEVVPTTPTSVVKGIAPGAAYPFVGSPTYVLNITAVQDLKTSTSLLNYFIANAGQYLVFLFTGAPGTTGSPTISVTATVVAPPAGGVMDKNLEFSVSFPVTGVPTYGVAP
jgi:hypothetical protein